MQAKAIVMLTMMSALGLNGYGAWAAGLTAQGGVSGGADLKREASASVGTMTGLALAANAATSARFDDTVAWEGVEGDRPALERDVGSAHVDSQYPEFEESEVHYTERQRIAAQHRHQDESHPAR